MTLKPLQTAKYVGVKWSPDHAFTSEVIEPLITPRYRAILAKEGRVALRSMGIADYDGMHINKAAEFDATIDSAWPKRDLLHAMVDDIARRQLNNQRYRLKFHLASPHGETQRRLVDRTSQDALLPPPEAAFTRRNMLESVFLDLPYGVLDDRHEGYLDEQFHRIRASLAQQAISAVGSLTYPEAYVITYQLNARDREALARFERQDMPQDT